MSTLRHALHCAVPDIHGGGGGAVERGGLVGLLQRRVR